LFFQRSASKAENTLNHREWENGELLFSPIPITTFPSHETGIAIPGPFPWYSHGTHRNFQYTLISNLERRKILGPQIIGLYREKRRRGERGGE